MAKPEKLWKYYFNWLLIIWSLVRSRCRSHKTPQTIAYLIIPILFENSLKYLQNIYMLKYTNQKDGV